MELLNVEAVNCWKTYDDICLRRSSILV